MGWEVCWFVWIRELAGCLAGSGVPTSGDSPVSEKEKKRKEGRRNCGPVAARPAPRMAPTGHGHTLGHGHEMNGLRNSAGGGGGGHGTGGTTPMEELQANHELFLQAFESEYQTKLRGCPRTVSELKIEARETKLGSGKAVKYSDQFRIRLTKKNEIGKVGELESVMP